MPADVANRCPNPECAAENKPGEAFCARCGARLCGAASVKVSCDLVLSIVFVVLFLALEAGIVRLVHLR